MRTNLAEALPSPQGKSLAMRPTVGESLSKPFAEQEDSAEIGAILELAISLSGREKKELAHAMGYSDPSLVSRWIQGDPKAQVQFSKVWAVRWFRPFWIAAQAKRAGANVGVSAETVIRISA